MSVEEGGREGGGRGADTELKTKTPHVNVGKNRGLAIYHQLYGSHCITSTVFSAAILAQPSPPRRSFSGTSWRLGKHGQSLALITELIRLTHTHIWTSKEKSLIPRKTSGRKASDMTRVSPSQLLKICVPNVMKSNLICDLRKFIATLHGGT